MIIGLLIQDIKINEEFFKVIRDFFKSIQNLQEKKTKLFLDTEDKIETMINLSKCQLKKKYISNVPLIISIQIILFSFEMSKIISYK